MSETQTDKVMGVVTTYFKLIEGRIKTVIEAAVSGDRQTEATKSVAATLLWATWDDIKEAVQRIIEEDKKQE